MAELTAVRLGITPHHDPQRIDQIRSGDVSAHALFDVVHMFVDRGAGARLVAVQYGLRNAAM
jgi:hypothetical protein